MDPVQKTDQLKEITSDVWISLGDLVRRRDREKKSKEIKASIMLYVQIAYHLGAEHAMRDMIDSGVIFSENDHDNSASDK